MPAREQTCTAKNRVRELRSPGTVRDEGSNVLVYSDSIFAKHLDDSIKALGLSVLKSPLRSPKANAICERVIGTIRREYLDWMIPISEAHLRAILKC
jgi:putative transposase